MKLKKLFKNWDINRLKFSDDFFESEWEPQTADLDAAWELYVELLTRPLVENGGDEQSALDSVHALFGITRDILRRRGRDCIQFSKIAIIVLNQIVRPFTAKWHPLALAGAFEQPEQCRAFRQELAQLQVALREYAKTLAHIANVEDLTELGFD